MMKRMIAALVCLAALTGSVAAQEGLKVSPETRARIIAAGKACRPDIGKFCASVQRGEGRILQCLVTHEKNLEPDCLNAMKAIRNS
jgi:hypothetical protein